jgi:hypothetical protein
MYRELNPFADEEVTPAEPRKIVTSFGRHTMAIGAVGLERGVDAPDSIEINDPQFIRDLRRLKELRSFLIQEAINLSLDDSNNPLSFGKLNLLRYSLNGRPPTESEWSGVEFHTQTLFRLLTEPLRRRFILGGIPMWVSGLPIFLALLALGALLGATVTSGPKQLLCYLAWLMLLGAIGSVAFVGMNALSVQQDITFDLNNRRLMILRIALGALFALVLTLPFGLDGFTQFISGIRMNTPSGEIASSKGITTKAVLLLLPFVLGFSTSLVIMILNRLVEAVQAFFGKTGTNELGQANSRPPQTSTAGTVRISRQI